MMRKNKYYSYSSFRSKPRSWLRLSLIGLLVGIPLCLVIAEFAARGIFQITGTANQLGITKEVPAAQAYQLQLVDTDGKPYPSATESGLLQVRRSPLLGYELIPNQTSKLWQINAQGLRLNQSLPVEKPANEIRIVILGGSTAFGTMAGSNQDTLASKIETLLNARLTEQTQQPEKFKPQELPFYADQIEAIAALPPRVREGKYRVITAAVPGYTSSNELAFLTHRIMAFNPDSVLVLDGYDDLRQEFFDRSIAKEIDYLDQLLKNPSDHYRLQLGREFGGWLNSLYLVKTFQRWVLPKSEPTYQPFTASQLPSSSSELQSRVERYRYNLKQIARLATGLPTIVAIQPEITGKQNSLSPEETKVLKDLGTEYSDRITKAYAQLDPKNLSRDLGNVKIVNLYRLYENFNQQAFYDPIHLTEAGNDKLARSLANVLQESFALQPATSKVVP